MSDVGLRDRELLELAAKAAGLPVEFQDEFGDSGVNGWYPCGRDEGGDALSWWNPLKDDGDALGLAARLRLIVDLEDKEISFWSVCKQAYIYISFEDDDYRRAIVRAAAEIGRAMK